MALSTYLPLQDSFNDEVLNDPAAVNRELPVFMAHGSFDPVLPMTLGRGSADLLQENGYRVEWHDYAMAHAVCAEEIEDIRGWLLSIFTATE
jgi:phospholipase/carboxylesterase